ncbi:MAG: DMT family transporter [Chlorobi bacterium]|nr:DMT family transporter [Chlorobiota bacterium]
MKISTTFKGYFFAFLATLALANVYIFSKAAMKEINFGQFAFYWFGLAIIWNLVYMLWRKKFNLFKALTKRLYLLIVIIGIFETVGTYSFFNAIKIIENPANVSFLANLVPIFVTIFGVTFLRERYNYIEIIGIVLTLTGTFLISYKGNGSLSTMFLSGSGYIVISSLCFAIGTIISKKVIHQIDPVLLSLNRVIYLFILASILLGLSGKSIIIPAYAFYNISIGSLLGPFLTAIASYSSLLYIEASRSSIIQSTKGLFVLIGTFLYFSLLPVFHEIIGGILSILGVILISLGKSALYRIRNRA